MNCLSHRRFAAVLFFAVFVAMSSERVDARDDSGVNAARHQVYAAQNSVYAEIHNLTAQRQKLDDSFYNSKAWREALIDLKSAQDTLAEAKRRALDAVYADPKYTARRIEIQSAELRFDELRRKPGVTQSEITSAAHEMLELRKAQSDAESKATSVEEVVFARDALVQAGNRVSGLREHHNQTLRTDPKLASAQDRVKAAKASMNSAAMALEQSAQASWRSNRDRLVQVLGFSRMNFTPSR